MKSILYICTIFVLTSCSLKKELNKNDLDKTEMNKENYPFLTIQGNDQNEQIFETDFIPSGAAIREIAAAVYPDVDTIIFKTSFGLKDKRYSKLKIKIKGFDDLSYSYRILLNEVLDSMPYTMKDTVVEIISLKINGFDNAQYSLDQDSVGKEYLHGTTFEGNRRWIFGATTWSSYFNFVKSYMPLLTDLKVHPPPGVYNLYFDEKIADSLNIEDFQNYFFDEFNLNTQIIGIRKKRILIFGHKKNEIYYSDYKPNLNIRHYKGNLNDNRQNPFLVWP